MERIYIFLKSQKTFLEPEEITAVSQAHRKMKENFVNGGMHIYGNTYLFARLRNTPKRSGRQGHANDIERIYLNRHRDHNL